ncbi:MAG TPA: alpha/beta hydrolase-fold protein [Tenuifilaceae bacterium]|nr:alpha/beta hydrolase-fold protein [Tenuifilaceae bacterium]HPE19698.1 alpha/beta hydrolase-fold protein [Tenuifilaceae bacterium]HPJ47232.1 alpha/beta hydrolase-fold protein [Tenuifilaceae bacterium]HPQ34224.1 alpha/beta hydrolase-fold protein [Tenuifilaceae bacterium]HRX69541.1 alpha/beta hydrolase-fold protein [Tenuifilaceae bacterium]
MKTHFLFVFTALFWFVGVLPAQVVFRLQIPENTPRGSSFYLAGSINNWVPGDAVFQFKESQPGELLLTIDSVPKHFEYKICRGTWNDVEVDSTGMDIKNREYSDSLGKNIQICVKAWRDRIPAKNIVSTASENVHYLPTSIEIPQLKRRRTVRVYFPPNYSSSQGFPVIYMFDGQNLFDNSTAFSGEWKVDETLDSLYRNRAFSCIVVAIYHGDAERLNELTPWPNTKKEGGDGEKFAKFIVKDLKPYIDEHYRTLPDRDNTVIMGSSLGGLMSLYMALEYPDVFGRAGVLSPSLWWSDEVYEHVDRFKKKRFQKFYISAGLNESPETNKNIEKVKKLLEVKGYSENELKVIVDPVGEHNEEFWSGEFKNAVKWLFDL